MDVLQEFLTRRLVSVGPDDDRLTKVRLAKDKLVQSLAENRRLSLGFTLAALRQDVSEEHPAIQAAAAALLSEWQTYKGAFESEPISLYRAMLIAALREAWEQDVRIAAAFAYLARNILRDADVGGEGPIWTALFEDAQGRLEAEAARVWSNGEVTAPKFAVKLPDVQLAVTKSKPDMAALTKAFAAASGPNDVDGNATEDGNEYLPNNPEAWVHSFAPLAAGAVADAIDKVKVGVTPTDINVPLKAVGDAVAVYAATLASRLNGAIAGVSRRSNLLWWKEAMFSPSLKRSYRELTPEVAALAMAIDLQRELPIYHPMAVEHFLTEAVRAQGKEQKSAALGAWIANARDQAIVDALRSHADGLQVATAPPGLLILQLIGDADLSATAKAEMTAGDFAVRVLRELQALAATKQDG